jgi:hypothetical protein
VSLFEAPDGEDFSQNRKEFPCSLKATLFFLF